MSDARISRRTVLKGGAALTGAAMLSNSRWYARAAPLQQSDVVIPWLDQPAENPVPEIVDHQLQWEALDSWITPADQFHMVSHFGQPEIDADDWSLEITGLVQHPMTLSLADLRAWPRQEVTFTLECAGNHGLDFFNGGIGNATWAGASLAPILDEAGPLDDGTEVVFYGTDMGEMNVRDTTFMQNFARAMSIQDAMNPLNLLCYSINGEPLPQKNGFPVRLIAPGWYGVANVKWLKRIELRNTRYAGHFMARDYVTIREEEHNGEKVWTETLVGPARIKSAPARVVRSDDGFRIDGAAWGAPIARVEVQIDDGDWREAELDTENVGRYAWRFWSMPWDDATAGEHSVTTRAIDIYDDVQPPADDPFLAGKITFWESNGQITRHVDIPE